MAGHPLRAPRPLAASANTDLINRRVKTLDAELPFRLAYLQANTDKVGADTKLLTATAALRDEQRAAAVQRTSQADREFAYAQADAAAEGTLRTAQDALQRAQAATGPPSPAARQLAAALRAAQQDAARARSPQAPPEARQQFYRSAAQLYAATQRLHGPGDPVTARSQFVALLQRETNPQTGRHYTPQEAEHRANSHDWRRMYGGDH